MSLEDTQESQETLIATSSTSSSDDQEIQIPDLKANMEKFSQDTENIVNDNELTQKVETQKIQESELDQAFHDEILEKLDIKKRENHQENQERFSNDKYLNEVKQLELSQAKSQVEQALSQDFIKIQNLVKEGLINSAQGQNLQKQVLKKAFDKLVQTEKIKRALSPELQQDSQSGFEEFSKSNPDFFISDGRKEVLNYLKSGNVNLGKDELNNISNIIRTVEKAAIDRYLQKVSHEKILRNSNESAKQRLSANAQKSGFSGNLSRTFTREQIGKMSSAEFTKYESAIMEQLKKGHIK